MKEKINAKTIIVLAILIAVGVLSIFGVKTAKTYLSGAASGTEPKNVIGVPGVDGKSAIVSWVSDKESMGVVEYGTTPASLLLRAVETEAVIDHKVTLSPLKSGVTYYFRIRVGEDVFDNNGIPYSFKTEDVQPDEPEVVSQPVFSPETNGVPQSVEANPPGVGCNRTTDYNNDKVINSVDFMVCQKLGVAGETAPAIVTPVAGQCQAGIDYNKDGTVNSLDIIKCRQGS